MSPELFALTVVAGALGAGARYIVDTLVTGERTAAFPVGILVVNITGSALLGLLTGMSTVVGSDWLVVLGVGALGGYTTFSTVMVDSVRLGRGGRRDWALINLLGTAGAAIAAAAVGSALGGLVPA